MIIPTQFKFFPTGDPLECDVTLEVLCFCEPVALVLGHTDDHTEPLSTVLQARSIPLVVIGAKNTKLAFGELCNISYIDAVTVKLGLLVLNLLEMS